MLLPSKNMAVAINVDTLAKIKKILRLLPRQRLINPDENNVVIVTNIMINV